LKISIIIPSFKRDIELENNIIFWQSELLNYDYHIIISNASCYEALKVKYKSNNRIVFLNIPKNYWWAESVNYGVKYSLKIEAAYIIVTNDDMTYPTGIIDLFLNNIDASEILTIPQLQTDGNLYLGSKIQGFFNDIVPYHFDKFDSALIDLTNGSCLFIPAIVFQNLGLFNFLDLPHYYSDVEFLMRVKKNKLQLRLLNFNPIIQGPPTEFYKRFTSFNIFYHKGSPLNFHSVIYFGLKLYGNIFNLFLGRGSKYIFFYLVNVLKFQIKKLFKSS
jgi:GT2 family glycosyltransferase